MREGAQWSRHGARGYERPGHATRIEMSARSGNSLPGFVVLLGEAERESRSFAKRSGSHHRVAAVQGRGLLRVAFQKSVSVPAAAPPARRSQTVTGTDPPRPEPVAADRRPLGSAGVWYQPGRA